MPSIPTAAMSPWLVSQARRSVIATRAGGESRVAQQAAELVKCCDGVGVGVGVDTAGDLASAGVGGF